MKVEYLRHEYTWSSQCITGPKVGWGVTGSSTPLDKDKLMELEKLAAGTVSDPADRVPIESMVYSQECGFTKMVTIPYHDGEDGRKSKLVHIYQVSEQVNMVPEAYLLPGDPWDDEKIGDYYAPVVVDTQEKNVDEILQQMECRQNLPAFLQTIYRALFGDTENINFVVEWSEHEFAQKSRDLMYTIHQLIPEILCKKASYQSFTRGDVSNVTFYFSREPVGKKYVKLDANLHLDAEENDELEKFFYERMAQSYEKKDTLYAQMMEKMSSYYGEHSGESNILKKLQWILVAICMKAGEGTLTEAYMMENAPQLFYWCEEDEELQEAVQTILHKIHQTHFDAREYLAYGNALLDGYTKRSEGLIAQESIWAMKHLFHLRPDLFKKQIKKIQQKNMNLYTILLCADIDQENSYAAQIFDSNTVDFLMFRTYLLSMNMEVITDRFKDHCLVKSIDLLNEDLFRIKNYQYFDEIIKKLGRQEEAAVILKSFVLQLQELRNDLDDERLETGSYVENLLNEYEGSDKYNLLTNEKAARQIKPATGLHFDDVEFVSTGSNSEVTDELTFSEEEILAAGRKRKKKKKKKQIQNVELEEPVWMIKDEEKDSFDVNKQPGFLGFLLFLFPMGFLSGSMFFILHLSMKIGHGKIALGMGGMWILVMLMFLSYLQTKHWTVRNWQSVGLTITEGLLIAFVGAVLSSFQVHFIYFIVLGAISILMSGYRFRQERQRG